MVFQFKLVGEILSIGVASFALLSAVSVSAVIINRMCIIYGGDVAVSAYGVIKRIMMFVLMPGLSIGQGMQPILGYNYGALRFDRALRVLKLALISSTICSASVFFLMFFIPGPFVSMFTTDSELIQLGIYAARRVFFVSYVAGIIFICPTTFQSIGKPVQSFITSISRSVLFLIPTVLILPRFFGLDGVWLAFPLTDFLSALLAIILLIPLIRDFKNRIINQPAVP